MRIAVLGAAGQLGADLCPILGAEAVPLRHGVGAGAIELAVLDSVAAALAAARPDAVVNLAAFNRVDRAEDEPEAAFAVNALGPRQVARWCGERDLPLVHVSTDYVFGLDAARSTPYSEADATGPINVYGASKLAGEHFVRSLCRRHFVVRTCGLYGPEGGPQATSGTDVSPVAAGRGSAGKGGNFVETMLRLGRRQIQSRGEGGVAPLRVVNDQTCTPSYTRHVAAALGALLHTDAYGLYHVTNAGACTWYELACEIFRLAGMEVVVQPITSAEFAAMNPGRTIARRPAYSVLDCSRYVSLGLAPLPPWQEALEEFLRCLCDRSSGSMVGGSGSGAG